MKLKQVYIKPGGYFSSVINEWATTNNVETIEASLAEGFEENIDGLVIFNQNSDESKEILDIRKIFDKKLKPVHRIDINGTLMVGVSNFSLWLERNACGSVLFLGDDVLKENANLSRYLESFKVQ
ncbi:MAG TPA: hypothetical protein PKN22_04235 [Taishania sp.]|nr:hypothetical protein [Taishania sp.]HNS41944.1 hypothetical protein [Taishania sp.]